MRPNELTAVYTVSDPHEADVIELELKHIGIPCVIEGRNQAGFAGILGIRVLVPANQADEAMRFLKKHELLLAHK